MIFLHPEFLYYMLLPMLVLFALLLTQKETQAHFFSQEVMEKLRVSANTLTQKARNALFLLMGIFMLIALAQPVIEDGVVSIKAKSADIIIALDISDSMLATDMYPNRLELAKQKAIFLLESDINERIGVVAFARNSYLVSPLSFDTDAVGFLLRQLDTSSITEKGTDILSVLKVVNESQKDKKKKYLLLLSDGGDKSDFSLEIEYAKEHGIVVFVLGLGSKKGAPIRLKNGDFIKQHGKIILTKLNETISKLATDTGGTYIQAVSSTNDIKTMFNEINKVSDEKELKSEDIKKYIPLFYYPLIMALFLLLISTSSMYKKGNNIVVLFISLFIFSSLELKAGVLDFMKIDEAKKAYENGEYEKSSSLYKNYADKSLNGEAYFNAGNSLYKQKKYKDALESYKKASFNTKENQAKNYANMGNAYVKEGNLEESINSYEKSLNLQDDKLTQENLEMVKKLLKKQEKKKQDDKKNEDKKDSENKNKDSKNKDSDEKDKKTKTQDSSKKSKDKKDSKEDMKSKDEKNKEQNKKDLDKLSEDKEKDKKTEAKNSMPQETSKNKMSDAEERKWLKELNMNKNTYMYKLNEKNYESENEKPW
jgi:Ca-activated chloride channel family protein